MGFTDPKIRVQILADGSQAKAEVREVDGIFGNLGRSAGEGLSSIAGPATVAAAAVTAVAATAINAGQAFFGLVNQAASYASVLFDATQKTGLAAETISTLKFNAEASGTALENVTNGAAKFAKVIGEADNGSSKAQKTLDLLGVTSHNLDEALNQAFSTIAKMPDGVDQLAAAQRAFGKSGADLIPLIKQMNGDLAGSVARAKELGIVFTEQDLKAADDFGDTLGFLGAQVKVLGSRFLLEFAPAITSGMQAASDGVSRHGKEIEAVLTNTGYVMRSIENASQSSTVQSAASWSWWAAEMFFSINPVNLLLSRLSHELLAVAIASGKAANASGLVAGITAGTSTSTRSSFGNVGLGGGVNLGRYADSIDDVTGGRAPRSGGGGRGPREKTPEQLKAERDRIERERIQAIRESSQREIEIRSATIDYVRARTDADLQQGIISEQQALSIHQKLTTEFLQFRIDKLDEEEQKINEVQHHQEETDRILHEKQVTNLKLEAELQKQRMENSEAYEKRLKRQVDLWADMIDNMEVAHKAVQQAMEDLGDGLEAAQGTGVTPEQNPFWAALFGGIGIDQMQSNVDAMKEILSDFGGFTADIFGQMANAVGQSIEAWALYGENIGTALRKATAAVLAQIAAQAAVKAIFQLAEGFAALAVGDARGAAMHFTAAAIYGAVAAGAAIGAKLVAGDSFKKGGATSAGGSRGGSAVGSGSNINRNPTPYSRASNDAYISGRRSDPDARFVAAAIDKLNQHLEKLSVARPGDVLVSGMKQRPGAVGHQVVKDIGTHSSVGTGILKAAGQRR
jgi:hypothetical protein